MISRNKFLCPLSLLAISLIGQTTKIETKDGIRYITTSIDYPITGTYLFKGAEPVIELNANGSGFYQSHEQPKKTYQLGYRM